MRDLISQIHDTPHKAVLAVSGAGTQAVAWVLGVAGASRTVLEVVVPYGRLSMSGFLGFEPEQSAAAETARQMARAAYRKARAQLRDGSDNSPPLGLACAAAIATDRPRRGEHRAFVATWSEEGTTTYSLRFHKGLRDRDGEEQVASRLIVSALAAASGLQPDVDLGLDLGLTEGDDLEVVRTARPGPLEQLLSGEAEWVTFRPGGHGQAPRMEVEGAAPRALLPGSFSPLHSGHRGLALAAEEALGERPAFEISVVNVDKPPLDPAETERRLAQFEAGETVVLTAAETFFKKARLFSGRTFVIGWDTAVRLVAPRYYRSEAAGRDAAGDRTVNPETAMLAALAEMWTAGARFLVAGRREGDEFHTLDDVPVPPGFESIFSSIPEVEFRDDISSSELRERETPGLKSEE
jgi:hypothetical protein